MHALNEQYSTFVPAAEVGARDAIIGASTDIATPAGTAKMRFCIKTRSKPIAIAQICSSRDSCSVRTTRSDVSVLLHAPVDPLIEHDNTFDLVTNRCETQVQFNQRFIYSTNLRNCVVVVIHDRMLRIQILLQLGEIRRSSAQPRGAILKRVACDQNSATTKTTYNSAQTNQDEIAQRKLTDQV